MATGLFASLPKPKYTGEHEEVPLHAQPKGPRIVGPGVIDESQIVLKVSVSSSRFGKMH
jgi:SNW domain-containing protein 1